MSEKKLSRWYFGGLASAGAACCTHPLDLLKVFINYVKIKQLFKVFRIGNRKVH